MSTIGRPFLDAIIAPFEHQKRLGDRSSLLTLRPLTHLLLFALLLSPDTIPSCPE